MNRTTFLVTAVLALTTACKLANAPRVSSFPMGERVPNAPLTYTVVDSTWRTELGEGFSVRRPQNRFLFIQLSATNGGGEEISLPLLTIEDANGKSYTETDKGEGITGWFGLLRNLAPAQTQQGQLVFDVPLASYKLKLPNGGAIGEEKWVTVDIPLRMDTNTTVQQPIGGGLK